MHRATRRRPRLASLPQQRRGCAARSQAPTVVEVKAPCKAFGDVHGQLGDRLELFKACANRPRLLPCHAHRLAGRRSAHMRLSSPVNANIQAAATRSGMRRHAACNTQQRTPWAAQVRVAEPPERRRQARQLRFHRRLCGPTVLARWPHVPPSVTPALARRRLAARIRSSPAIAV